MEILQNKRRLVSTKVDLTAMVDLGFLLITFFMLATSFSKPKTMQVLQPAEGDPTPVPQSKTSTLIIGTGDKVYTYSLPEEMSSPNDFIIDSTDYSPDGLRKYIQRRQSEVEAKWNDRSELFVIIKPLPGASFKNMVDVLDEMLINNVKKYAIMDAHTALDSIVVEKVGEKW